MAVKTITIDIEAYETLARRKRKGQSFSTVIKTHFARGGTGRDLLEAVRQFSGAEETLDHVDALIRRRRRHPARAPRW